MIINNFNCLICLGSKQRVFLHHGGNCCGRSVFRCHPNGRGHSGTRPASRLDKHSPVPGMLCFVIELFLVSASAPRLVPSCLWDGAFKRTLASNGDMWSISVNPLSYFSFQPVLHNWCNKGRGMCHPVCGMVHIKEPLPQMGTCALLVLSHWAISRSSQCSTTDATKAVVCAILSVGWCI